MTAEQPLSRKIVVRGGRNRDPKAIASRIEQAFKATGKPVLSVFVTEPAELESYDQALYRVCEEVPIPHTQIQVTEMQKVVEAGFEVRDESGPGESPYHHHVYFRVPVEESRVQQFIDCMGAPIANPAGGRKRNDNAHG